MPKLKEYQIDWKCYKYGSSYVQANNKKEAKEKAILGKDYNFDESEYESNWVIYHVEYSDDVEVDNFEKLRKIGIDPDKPLTFKDQNIKEN